MLAVRASDGVTAWQGPKALSALRQPRGADGTVPRTPAGELLVNLDDALAAVDPRDGTVAWKVDGRVVGGG
jgi:hypothetical protein